ncbi:MAG: hypothetical protein V4592_09200 [Bacteroidota bacterium]
MKKKIDDEIQRGHLPNDDNYAYQLLLELLSAEPETGLPYDFAAKVKRKVEAEARQQSELRSFGLSSAVVALLTGIVYGLFLLLAPLLGGEFSQIAARYKWVFILGMFGVLTIQYFDQVFIKSKIFKSPKR